MNRKYHGKVNPIVGDIAEAITEWAKESFENYEKREGVEFHEKNLMKEKVGSQQEDMKNCKPQIRKCIVAGLEPHDKKFMDEYAQNKLTADREQFEIMQKKRANVNKKINVLYHRLVMVYAIKMNGEEKATEIEEENEPTVKCFYCGDAKDDEGDILDCGHCLHSFPCRKVMLEIGRNRCAKCGDHFEAKGNAELIEIEEEVQEERLISAIKQNLTDHSFDVEVLMKIIALLNENRFYSPTPFYTPTSGSV